MGMTREQRATYASRAAEFLEDGTVEWVRSAWIRDISAEAKIGSGNSMGAIRAWIRDRGLFSRNKNKRCGVCAEGALMLAIAEDPNIPDDAYAENLLLEFLPEVQETVVSFGWFDSPEDVTSLPSVNDDFLKDGDKYDVVRLLRQMSDA